MESIKYGFICFAYSKNETIAKLIAWSTKSKWSHSFITLPPILGKEIALEADSQQVAITKFDLSYRDNANQSYEVYRFKVDQSIIDSAILNMLNSLEESYGYLEYLWFMWRYFNLLFGRDIKSHDNWIQQGVVCSGLVRQYIEFLGYGNLFSEFGKDAMSAEDIYKIVKNNPLFELIESKV